MEELRLLYLDFLNEFIEKRFILKVLNLSSLKQASFPSENQNLDRYTRQSTQDISISFIDPLMISGILRSKIDEFRSSRKIFDYITTNNLSPFKKLTFEEDLRYMPSISRNLIADFISRIIELSILETNSNFNPVLFDKAYSELEEFLLADTFKYKILTSLYGPKGNVDEIILPNAVIKKADYKIAKMFCLHYPHINMMGQEMMENDYYIEIERTIEKIMWREQMRNEPEIIPSIFNQLVLSNFGNIELGKFLYISDAWPIIRTQTMIESFEANRYSKYNKFIYEITEKSKNSIIEKSKKLSGIDFEKLDDSIKASLKRLKKSKSTFDIEDKIIELTLSIEYLINTQNFEVTLQLCLKIIKLYSDSNQDEKLFKALKEFYDLRSNVVHGKKKKIIADEKTINLIHQMEMIVLDILIKFIILNQKYSFDQINIALTKSLHINKSINEILEKPL